MGTPSDYQSQIPPLDYYGALVDQQCSSLQTPIPQDYLYQQRSQEQYLDYHQSTSYGSCFTLQSSHNHGTAFDSQITTPGDAIASVSSITSGSISGKSESTTLVAPTDDGVSASTLSQEAREKSKNAARMRRKNENIEFERLSHVIPLPTTAKVMLDKASIVRLALNFLKVRQLFASNEEITSPSALTHSPWSNIMLEALDGFPLILSNSGSVTYVGETVKTLLGLAKWDLAETLFEENVKQREREELENHLKLTSSELSQINCPNTEFRFERRFTIRVKCILSRRNSGLSSEGYKTLHYGGYIIARMLEGKEGPKKVVQRLCGIASTLPAVNWNSTEIRMGRDMFMFRANLDLHVTYADEQLQSLTGYQARDIIGTSLYQLIHVGDSEELAECHTILLTKGQVITRYFRLLHKYGGWVWAQTQATILRNTRGSKLDCIIGVTYVLTGIRAPAMKLDVKQLQVDSFGTSNYGHAIISKPTNPSRRKRSYPAQNALQVETVPSPSNFSSKVSIINANFYQNLKGGVEVGGGNVWSIYSNSSNYYQPPPQPNHAGLISDAYANQNGIAVQQLTGMPAPTLNAWTVEETPHYGVSFSDTSVPSSSIPSSISTNSYMGHLMNHQADANCPECWQEPFFYHQS